MKRRHFLLAILLPLCVLVPLQKAAAKVTVEIIDGSNRTITTDDTNDVVFKIRFASKVGDSSQLSRFFLQKQPQFRIKLRLHHHN